MIVCLSSFPPSEALDNFLAQFIKAHAPSDRREKIIFSLYAVIYSGPRSTTPAINEIPSIVANFFDRPVNKRFESSDFISQTGRPKVRRVSLGRGGMAAVAAAGSGGGGGAAEEGAGAAGAAPAKPTKRPLPPPPVAAPSVPQATVLYDFTSEGEGVRPELKT